MHFPLYKQAGWGSSKEDTIPFFEFTIAFIVIMYLLETYLDIRQHRMLKVEEFPPELAKVLKRVDDQLKSKGDNETKSNLLKSTKEKFDSSRAYGLDKSQFHLFSSAIQQVEGIVTLCLGFLPYVWTHSQLIVEYLSFDSKNDIIVSMVYTVIATIYGMLFALPFEIYSTWVIEERHGFNKQTPYIFVTDKLKGIALMILIGLPVQAALLYIIQSGGTYFYVYVWAFLFVFSIIMLTIYPTWIMPLFNKFTPLEEGELRTAIENLAQDMKFPLTKLFVCDGSKRSSHSNAYFYGFFKSKRIVLYDTLLTQATNDEIVGILAHELGHWKLWHTLQGFIIQQVYIFAAFTVFGQCLNDARLYRAFGFVDQPAYVGLVLFFQTVWSPVDKFLSWMVTQDTRRKEFEADAFAVENSSTGTESLQSGLVKISIENLSNFNPDPYYSNYHYSHPPLVERLKAIETVKAKVSKKKQ